MKNVRDVVNLAVIHDKKLVLGYKEKGKGMYIPLGGKRVEGETDRQCLERELSEEIKSSITLLLENAEYVGQFTGKTPTTNSPLQAELYKTTIGNLKIEPNGEITKLQEFFYEDIMIEPLVSNTTRKIAKALKDLNLIF